MDETRSGRRAGRKRARTGAVKVAMSLVLLAAPRLPSAEALKLASISEDRRHLGVGLLRAVEVVRGRYERAWALVSASEPSSSDLDTALELLQANAKQWESLEPAVKLWTERDNEGPHEGEPAPSKHHSQGDRSSASSERDANRTGEAGSEAEEGHHEERTGAPGVSDTTSRIYDEAASLLAHNRAVLGQALARSGRTSEGIVELEAACPEILEYQQNAQGRRDSKSWLHCYANLAEMYKTQKRFEDASNLLARMPWLPSPQQAPSATAEAAAAEAEGDSTAEKTPPTKPGSGDQIPVVPLAAASRHADITTTTAGDDSQTSASKPSSNPEHDASSTTSEEGTGLEPSPPHEHSHEHGGGKDESGDPLPSSAARGEGARSEASPARGAGAARVAGLNKAAAAASAAAAAESAAAAAAAVETGAEAAARALVQRHADAMRASMNELVGELAVTTATRPSASKNWLDSRVLEAEEILAAVRSGSLTVAPTTDQQQHNSGDAVPEDVPSLPVGLPGHADILREASHYLSAVKGVAGQGWAYIDNELSRMERHPPQAVKQGFQSRREVIHTFRYLLMKAQQYASENQARTTPGSGSGASQTSLGLRGKNRGRKASASSKAPRKEGAARKQSPRSQSESSSKQSDGLLTLFVGAAVALLVAAVSTGRVGSQGRRREVVRQRTATRAAKTVGRYVRPPQRGAVPALLSYLWGNLKRSGLMVSSQATSSASLMRTLILTAWAAAFDRLRTALGRSRIDAAGGKPPSSSSSKKSASSGQGHHKQRSKKGGKKTTPSLPPPHPPASLSRDATVSITPPVSPPRRPRSSAADAPINCTDVPVTAAAAPAEAKSDVAAAAAVVASIGKHPAREASGSSKTTPSSGDAVDASASPATEKAAERPADTSDPSAGCGVGAGGVSDATADDAAPAVSVPTAAVAATAAAVPGVVATAVELAAEMTAGVRFPDVMTAEQVQAMVEEDERAWEQARLSEKLQSKTNAAAAARPQLPRSVSSGSGVAKRAETGVVNAGAVCGLGNDGWSEVGSSSSRARSGGGGGAGGGGGDGARGRVLSMRNVRAVARASRPSSPGSDPATTTSASSSECSEGSKDKPRHRHVVDSRGGRGGRGSGEAGNATIGTGKGAIPRAGRGGVPASRGGASSAGSGSGGGGSGAGRAHATRPPQGRSVASRAATKDTEQAYPRPSRASYAPWATPSPQAPRVTGKPQPPSARSAVSASATLKSGSPGVDSDLARAAAPAKLPLRADRSHTNVLRQPLRAKAAPVAAGVGKAAELKNVGGVDVGIVSKTSPAVVVETAAPAPVAWTNTPSHPLGMKAEPAPLPPASEPPRPPPQHQQHWQRQQQREQQQRQQQHHQLQQQQQQQQHFFHQQESHLLPMPAAPVQQQQHHHHHHHVGGHHYPPLSLPPHHHHQHNRQHHQPPLPPHEVVPARFLPPSDEPFAPALAPGTAVAQMPSATVSHAAPSPMVYTAQVHPTPMHTSSPTVSPRGSGDDVGDSSVNDNVCAGSPNGETSHYHVVEGSYDSPGLSGVGDGGSGSGGGSGGHFSLDAPAVIPPPQIVVMPSSQEQQQGSFSPLAMLPSEDGGGSGGGSGGASAVFGQGPPVGYCRTTGGGGGSGSGDAGEVFEALMGALCWQVEYYFSADNLVNDAYLRGLMDSDGFVAVSKIMVFNRVRCMTSDMSLLIAAMRRSTELELQERDNSGKVCVRTVHSPLHWTKEQVPLPKAPPAVVAIEPEHVPHEAGEVAHEEKPVPLGEGKSVSCEAVSCVTVPCETAVSCEPPQDGQE